MITFLIRGFVKQIQYNNFTRRASATIHLKWIQFHFFLFFTTSSSFHNFLFDSLFKMESTLIRKNLLLLERKTKGEVEELHNEHVPIHLNYSSAVSFDQTVLIQLFTLNVYDVNNGIKYYLNHTSHTQHAQQESNAPLNTF